MEKSHYRIYMPKLNRFYTISASKSTWSGTSNLSYHLGKAFNYDGSSVVREYNFETGNRSYDKFQLASLLILKSPAKQALAKKEFKNLRTNILSTIKGSLRSVTGMDMEIKVESIYKFYYKFRNVLEKNDDDAFKLSIFPLLEVYDNITFDQWISMGLYKRNFRANNNNTELINAYAKTCKISKITKEPNHIAYMEADFANRI